MRQAPESQGNLSNEALVQAVLKKKKKDTYFYLMLSIIGVVGFFLIWQIAVSTGLLNSKYVPAPLQVFNVFVTKLTDPKPDGSTLGINILSSLQVSLTGFLLAICIGIPLGWLMGWYRGFEAFIRPIFEIMRPIPPVSWIPLTIVWLGIGLRAKAFIVFFSAFVSCVINSYTGIKQTSQVLINVAKCCGASNFTIFWRVAIPSALPMTFAGIRVSLGNAWSTLVAAEMLAASSGLGYMILMGRQFARPDLIILGIVVIGVIGVLFASVLQMVENKVLRWRR